CWSMEITVAISAAVPGRAPPRAARCRQSTCRESCRPPRATAGDRLGDGGGTLIPMRSSHAILDLAGCIFAALATLVLGSDTARAAPQSSIVVDAGTGEVLSASDPSALWRPASLTKLMTLYITFEELAAGRLKLAEILTVSPYAAAMPPSQLGLLKGA